MGAHDADHDGADAGPEDAAQRQARRPDDPRSTATDRVAFHLPDGVLEGWALNISRGGLRAIVEQAIDIGAELEVVVLDSGERHAARVVWVQHEKGGAVVGLAFLDSDEGAPPPSHGPRA